jgi:hypothetical protein
LGEAFPLAYPVSIPLPLLFFPPSSLSPPAYISYLSPLLYFYFYVLSSFLLILPRVLANASQVPLERYFPEYTGGPNINKATKYVLWRFMQENRAQLSVFPQ